MEEDVSLTGIKLTDKTKISAVLEHCVDALPLTKYTKSVVESKQIKALEGQRQYISDIQKAKVDGDFDQINSAINNDSTLHEFTQQLLLCRCEYYKCIQQKFPKAEGTRGGVNKG